MYVHVHIQVSCSYGLSIFISCVIRKHGRLINKEQDIQCACMYYKNEYTL